MGEYIMNKITKKTTISKYLEEEKNALLKQLLSNYFLNKVSIELFFKVFDTVNKTPKDVANFILDEKNGFDLGVFGSRASGLSKYYGYNGKGNYQGVECTLGSSHSKFHG